MEKRQSRSYDWNSEANTRRVRRRHAANFRLQFYGIAAIVVAIGLLGTLLGSLIVSGYSAFVQTKAQLEIFLDPELIDKADIQGSNFREVFAASLRRYFPDVKEKDESQLTDIFSSEARFAVRDVVAKNPDIIGKTITLKVALSDPFDQYSKGVIPSHTDALSTTDRSRFRAWQRSGLIETRDGAAFLKINLFLDPAKLKSDNVAGDAYGAAIDEGLRALVRNSDEASWAKRVIAANSADIVKAYVAANAEKIGSVQSFTLPLSPNYAIFANGGKPKTLNPRFKSEKQFDWLNALKDKGLVSSPFAFELFTNSDSRFPEQAGLAGAIAGSFYALLVCLAIAFPVGIAAAIYLEEFAPKNRWTYLIEVNINNLAAVPSVVFGLLGLALFINTFGLPRSAPMVGGMVLALMTLPTIIIAARLALRAVPPSIREAALGVGASEHQVVLHHVLPLAMPGILTGTIIGMARALGETAPLLLIGMNAFIPSIENLGLMEPATALPTQIYSWADSPERGFVARTSAAILVLLGFLVVMNAVAIFLRQRFERKW